MSFGLIIVIMYDYRLEGHLKNAVIKEEISVVAKILRSNLMPKNRLYYYFHLAVQKGKCESARTFLAHRVVHLEHLNKDFGEKSKVTALHEAILHCHPPMVKLLLACGASLETEAVFPFCRSTAPELAQKVNNKAIINTIKAYKHWLGNYLIKLTEIKRTVIFNHYRRKINGKRQLFD